MVRVGKPQKLSYIFVPSTPDFDKSEEGKQPLLLTGGEALKGLLWIAQDLPQEIEIL